MIGGGPAGLIAAERLGRAGVAVTVYDRMPSLGRKFLMAGRGGLNLTHSEPLDAFAGRYGARTVELRPYLEAFSPVDLRAWCEGLGQPTFVGSSGRVFPKAMKASPLLRAWLARLEAQGTDFRPRHDWRGWDAAGRLVFDHAGAVVTATPDATILALGGASWARLGSDGAWAATLHQAHVSIAPFKPANSGLTVAWSPIFRDRFAGAPLKGVALSFAGATARGDAVISAYGIEGGAVYALGPGPREAVLEHGRAALSVDLRPDMDAPVLAERLARTRPGLSVSERLRKALSLTPAAIGLLREGAGAPLPPDPAALAALVKAAPVEAVGVPPMDRAISTAGGARFESLTGGLRLPGPRPVWLAGEMLDWEAPTGGYLLQACFATGVAAADGVLAELNRDPPAA